jgi:uncharacterized protein YbjQ (UPF0145 family)
VLVSSNHEIQGSRVVREIGRISAATGWGGVASASSEELRAQALRRLIAKAQDYEADAIVDVDYSVDGIKSCDLSACDLKRVIVSGVAVRLARG